MWQGESRREEGGSSGPALVADLPLPADARRSGRVASVQHPSTTRIRSASAINAVASVDDIFFPACARV